MKLAIAAVPQLARSLVERFESRGLSCALAEASIPEGAECLLSFGDPPGSASLEAAAAEAGLPFMRVPEAGALAGAEAAAWALSLAGRRKPAAAGSNGGDSHEGRAEQAERRSLELIAANDLLERRAADLGDALSRLDAANRELTNELLLAGELQMSLLPRTYPADVPLEFAHKFIPLNKIGGDFFDVIRLDERSLSIVIADVSGHGAGPALVTAMFKGSYGLVSKSVRSPAALMAALNREMTGFLTTGHYVTAFCALLDLETLEMRYCSAGHPNQLLVRADGRVAELATMGFLLGMMEGMEYEEGVVSLEPGDTVAFFTDGLLEAADRDGRLFGREGIAKSLSTRLGAGPLELSNGLLSDLLDWTAGSEAADDVTLLLVQAIESL